MKSNPVTLQLPDGKIRWCQITDPEICWLKQSNPIDLPLVHGKIRCPVADQETCWLIGRNWVPHPLPHEKIRCPVMDPESLWPRRPCGGLRRSLVAWRVTLVFAFGFFCSKMLGGGFDLQMLFCHSLTAGWVVGTLRGGGDTQTLPAVIERVWTFCTRRWWEHKNILLINVLVPTSACSHRATWWKFHYFLLLRPIFTKKIDPPRIRHSCFMLNLFLGNIDVINENTLYHTRFGSCPYIP